MYKLGYIFFIFLFIGCTDAEYVEDSSISSYTLDKYANEFKKENVKFLKCVPTLDGKMLANYTTDSRDNSFPSVIRFDYINQSYNVYFDVSYKNGPKQKLLNDIDQCYISWKSLLESKKSWK